MRFQLTKISGDDLHLAQVPTKGLVGPFYLPLDSLETTSIGDGQLGCFKSRNSELNPSIICAVNDIFRRLSIMLNEESADSEDDTTASGGTSFDQMDEGDDSDVELQGGRGRGRAGRGRGGRGRGRGRRAEDEQAAAANKTKAVQRVLMKIVPRKDHTAGEILQTSQNAPAGCIDNRGVWGFCFFVQLADGVQREKIDTALFKMCCKNNTVFAKLKDPRESQHYSLGRFQMFCEPGVELPAGLDVRNPHEDFSRYFVKVEHALKFVKSYMAIFCPGMETEGPFSENFSIEAWNDLMDSGDFCDHGADLESLRTNVQNLGMGGASVDFTDSDQLWYWFTIEQFVFLPHTFMPCADDKRRDSHMRPSMMRKNTYDINNSNDHNVKSTWDVYRSEIFREENDPHGSRWLPPHSPSFVYLRPRDEYLPSVQKEKCKRLQNQLTQANAEDVDLHQEELEEAKARLQQLRQGEGIIELIAEFRDGVRSTHRKVCGARFASISGQTQLQVKIDGDQYRDRWIRVLGCDYANCESNLVTSGREDDWKASIIALRRMANRGTTNLEMSETQFTNSTCANGAELFPREFLTVWYLHRAEAVQDGAGFTTEWDDEVHASVDMEREELEESTGFVVEEASDTPGSTDPWDVGFSEDGDVFAKSGYQLVNEPEKLLHSIRKRKERDAWERFVRQSRLMGITRSELSRIAVSLLHEADDASDELKATQEDLKTKLRKQETLACLFEASAQRRKEEANVPTGAVWARVYNFGEFAPREPCLPQPGAQCSHCYSLAPRFFVRCKNKNVPEKPTELLLCTLCARDEPALAPLTAVGPRRAQAVQRVVDTVVDGVPDWQFRLTTRQEVRSLRDHAELEQRFASVWSNNPYQARSINEEHGEHVRMVADRKARGEGEGTMMFPSPKQRRPEPRRNLTPTIVHATEIIDLLTAVMDIRQLGHLGLPVLLSCMCGTHKGRVCGLYERRPNLHIVGTAATGKSFTVEKTLELFVPKSYVRYETHNTAMNAFGFQENMDQHTACIVKVHDETNIASVMRPGAHIDEQTQAKLLREKQEKSQIQITWKGLQIIKDAGAGASRVPTEIHANTESVHIDNSNHLPPDDSPQQALIDRFSQLVAMRIAPSAMGDNVDSHEIAEMQKRLPMLQQINRTVYFRAMATEHAFHAGVLPYPPIAGAESLIDRFRKPDIADLPNRRAEDCIMWAAKLALFAAHKQGFCDERSPFRDEIDFNPTMLRKMALMSAPMEKEAALCFGFQRAQVATALRSVTMNTLISKSPFFEGFKTAVATGAGDTTFSAIFEQWIHSPQDRPWHWSFGQSPKDPASRAEDHAARYVVPKDTWKTNTWQNKLRKPRHLWKKPDREEFYEPSIAEDRVEMPEHVRQQVDSHVAELRAAYQSKLIAGFEERHSALTELYQNHEELLEVPQNEGDGDETLSPYVRIKTIQVAGNADQDARVMAKLAEITKHDAETIFKNKHSLDFIKTTLYGSFKKCVVPAGKTLAGCVDSNGDLVVFPEHSVLKVIPKLNTALDEQGQRVKTSFHTDFVIALSVVALDQHMTGNEGLLEYYKKARCGSTACGTQLIPQPFERMFGSEKTQPVQEMNKLQEYKENLKVCDQEGDSNGIKKLEKQINQTKRAIEKHNSKQTRRTRRERIMPNLYDVCYIPAHEETCECLKICSTAGKPSGTLLTQRARAVALAYGIVDVEAIDTRHIMHKKCSCFRKNSGKSSTHGNGVSVSQLFASQLGRSAMVEPLPPHTRAESFNPEIDTVANYLKTEIGYTDAQVDGSLGLINVYASPRTTTRALPPETHNGVIDPTQIYPEQEVTRQISTLAGVPWGNNPSALRTAELFYDRTATLYQENATAFEAFDNRVKGA